MLPDLPALATSSANGLPAGFLALGDSYTIGEGVGEAQRWPIQLAARLKAAGVEIGGVDIVARTGWTTDELQAAIDARDFTPPYAMVSLLIGVNNQYRGRDADNYADEFARLLEFAVGMAGGEPRKLIVVSIPDWGATRFAEQESVDALNVAAEIDRFNARARALTEARGAHWVDVTGISRDTARDWLADDGLHPSAKQYSRWVEAMFQVAGSIVQTSSQRRP